MKSPFFLVLCLCACRPFTAPDTESRRVLAEISGYNADDPSIEVVPVGRAVEVTIRTYGSSCNSKASAEVYAEGMTATVVPFNFAPPVGSGCPRDLRIFVHHVTVTFPQSGAVTIRVKGIDTRGRSPSNLIGDTITIHRTAAVS